MPTGVTRDAVVTRGKIVLALGPLGFQRRFEDIVRGQLARLRGDLESGTRG